jgi:primosomal protein N' (replication factor Y) (superfamily II helicase)
LARWMADYYCAPLGLALKQVLPEPMRNTVMGAKLRLWVQLRPGVEAVTALETLKGAVKQRAALQYLQQVEGGWLADLIRETQTTAAIWRGLQDKGLVEIGEQVMERDPFVGEEVEASEALLLHDEQTEALKVIEEERAATKPKVVLLHGVTGSGKTEVYLQAIANVLDAGRSALVLVPEIALTPQAVERFRNRFLGRKIRVAVLHSNLSTGERHDQWQQIRSGRARVIIGARSAVFAPVQDLGLIVVDEEHEASYKQQETPSYHARDVAIMRGHVEKVPVVLGSATPALESYVHALAGKYRMCRLTVRAAAAEMPVTHILDLRQEFKKSKTPRLLADRLIEAIRNRLEKKEQTILFLNRRGYATSLQCPSCGHVEMCPHCSVPVTYHRREGRLRCHFCNHAAAVPNACPKCSYADYTYSGVGTEKIEQAVGDLFPAARVVRMDSDTMKGKGAHRRTLREFADGKIDILVGTQMIAKGLHFPNVTCVGVIHADLALQLPDYRASERVFQILMQVSGRSGRGNKAGEVYVQTRTPFHPAIQFARHHDYEGFADQELEFRRALNYPPVQRSILVTWRGRSDEKTAYVAEITTKRIVELVGKEVLVTAPAPAPIAKLEDYFRYHLFLRTTKPLELARALRPLFVGVKWPEGIKASVDVDPLYLL